MFDGQMAYDHSGSAPVYATNSGGRSWSDGTGPLEDGWEADGEMVRNAYTLRKDDDAFSQPGDMVRKEFDDDQRATQEIGRAPVCTPVTNAKLVCRLLLQKKKSSAVFHEQITQ